MDDLLRVLRLFVSTERVAHEEIARYFQERRNDRELYVQLIIAAGHREIGDSTRLAAVAQLRNMFRSCEDCRECVRLLFIEALPSLDEQLIHYFAHVSDDIVGASPGINWWHVCGELAANEKPGFMLPLRALSAEKSPDILPFIPLLLGRAREGVTIQSRTLAMSIMCRYFNVNGITADIGVDLLAMCVNFVNTNAMLTKVISLTIYVLRDCVEGTERAVEVLRWASAHFEEPRVAIKGFDLITAMIRNPRTSGFVVANFRGLLQNLYWPFFKVECSAIADAQQFVCEYDFDSFAASSDPRAAAYRSLERVCEVQPSVCTLVASFANELPDGADTVFSKYHLLAAAVNSFEKDQVQRFVISACSSLSSDSPFVVSGALLVLRQTRGISVPGSVIVRCLALLNETSIVAYFAASCCVRLLDRSRSGFEVSEEHVHVIVRKAVEIADAFGTPEILEVISLICDKACNISTPLIDCLPIILRVAFSMIEFSMAMDAQSVSTYPPFRLLLTVVFVLRECPRHEKTLCQYLMHPAILILSRTTLSSVVTPLIDVMCNAVFYAPLPLDGAWNCFDLFLGRKFDSLSIDSFMILLTNIILKDPENEMVARVPSFCTQVMSTVPLQQCASLITACIRVSPSSSDVLYDPVFSGLVSILGEQDLNALEECVPLIIALLHTRKELFVSLAALFPGFIDDFIESCGPLDITHALPLLTDIIPIETRAILTSQLGHVTHASLSSNSWDEPDSCDVTSYLIRRML